VGQGDIQTEINAMLEDGVVPDFEELYLTGRIVPARGKPLVPSPITPETPGFEHLPLDQIEAILTVEGF